ncbi:MAG: hypothetical protein M1825_003541 [Sarcosagium campestre]|nr:MAG: hypothetical protein M1825_003541 [Sarcosagium campestre]
MNTYGDLPSSSLRSAPYAPQDEREVVRLVQSLESRPNTAAGVYKKPPFSSKKTSFALTGASNLIVDSWRFQEWDYEKPDLPIYARGLFTHSPQPGSAEIVVRGYNKFFNINEVNQTRWRNIEQNTRGPYELSVKENGCIIFMSGLPDDTLLVCSKHSTGARQDAELSHAIFGERWVDRQLQAIGKSRADLARELRQRNATAVAELCDDSFEEHVLAYEEDRAGLYLHGININVPEFMTYPGHLVQEFAANWGFKKTDFLVYDDIAKARRFLEEVAESGSWQGKDVEGFVIRCQTRNGPSDRWIDWFFKYKFEEPYLMYRQWREATKAMIAGKPQRLKKHVKATEEYLRYARKQLAKNPNLASAFNQNHGIIAMREGFLQEKGLKGSDIVRMGEGDGSESRETVTKDIVLVPVATIGCGKTTVALALQKLFGWGHVQNDNIEGKNRPQRFATQVCALLVGKAVVIADRNNHQARERKQIIEDVLRINGEARLVALNYVHKAAGADNRAHLDDIRRVTRERVMNRGDNHQTIRADSAGSKKVIGIMEGFISRFEPVDPHRDPDGGFDAIIDLDVLSSSRENLETIISRLHDTYPKLFTDMPTAMDLDDAIEAAMAEHIPKLKNISGGPPSGADMERRNPAFSRDTSVATGKVKGKSPKVEYFAVRLAPEPIRNALETTFSAVDPAVASFYRQLEQQRRIQPSFHVTLIHSAHKKVNADTWSQYMALLDTKLEAKSDGDRYASKTELETCRVELERIVWDQRVMCIVVRLLDAEDKGLPYANHVAHITVGTATQAIKPKESNDLISAWLERGSGVESGIGELAIVGGPALVGSVRAESHKK